MSLTQSRMGRHDGNWCWDGREIKETRQALGLTQAEVAERLGVAPSYISAVEAGRRNLTLGQLANIANAMRLGIDISFVRPDGLSVRIDRIAAARSRAATC
jgi:transcriptional regulator with XRE-family HTH domain